MIKVEVLKDFRGSNHGYDSVEYKKGEVVEISDSLYDSVETVRNYDKKKEKLPAEHWVKESGKGLTGRKSKADLAVTEEAETKAKADAKKAAADLKKGKESDR